MIRRLRLLLVLPITAITFTGVFFTFIGMGLAAEPPGLSSGGIDQQEVL